MLIHSSIPFADFRNARPNVLKDFAKVAFIIQTDSVNSDYIKRLFNALKLWEF